MKGKVLLFAPPGSHQDDPLVRTRWMADRTREALARDGKDTVALLDDDATRAGFEAAIDDDIAGIAFFSHGRRADLFPRRRDATTPPKPRSRGDHASRDDALIGANGPALDRDNLYHLHGRWVHAVACHSGTELAAQACHHGAECFAGYTVSLIVEWHPDAIPGDVVNLVIDLVTRTTRNLADGERSERRILDDVNNIAEEIQAWCSANPERADGLGLEVTAQQLALRLVLRLRDETLSA